ncbi:dihydroxyacetone kinase subunit DhaK [Streptomyces albulus]|nr:dihydroxyacetone kinase subunit DhaK [Streptomyces noursei]
MPDDHRTRRPRTPPRDLPRGLAGRTRRRLRAHGAPSPGRLRRGRPARAPPRQGRTRHRRRLRPLPAFAGLVGPGLADAAAIGDVFASPSAEQVYRTARAADGGAGVLLSCGNYAGDVMHFGLAARRLAAEGTATRTVLVTDDVASGPRRSRASRSTRPATDAAWPATSSSSRSPARPPNAATTWTRSPASPPAPTP